VNEEENLGQEREILTSRRKWKEKTLSKKNGSKTTPPSRNEGSIISKNQNKRNCVSETVKF